MSSSFSTWFIGTHRAGGAQKVGSNAGGNATPPGATLWKNWYPEGDCRGGMIFVFVETRSPRGKLCINGAGPNKWGRGGERDRHYRGEWVFRSLGNLWGKLLLLRCLLESVEPRSITGTLVYRKFSEMKLHSTGEIYVFHCISDTPSDMYFEKQRC